MINVRTMPDIKHLFEGANHVDIKTFEGDVTLREFIAGFLNYHPAWVKFLYGVRFFFVRLLGMTQKGIPREPHFELEDISFTVGEKATFFTVAQAQEDVYWFAYADDAHLRAYAGVVQELLPDGKKRFYVITIVHYHNWAGPVYFNVIRPFHHLVVNRMGQAGVGA